VLFGQIKNIRQIFVHSIPKLIFPPTAKEPDAQHCHGKSPQAVPCLISDFIFLLY